MQRWCLAAAAAAAVAGFTAGAARLAEAQTGFNGTITYRTNGPDSSAGELVESQKGSHVRVEGFSGRTDSTASRGGMIYDQATGNAILLLPAQHVYVRVSKAQLQGQADSLAARQARTPHADSGAKLTMTRTGRSQTIAGVQCDVYRGTGVTGGTADTGEVCVAPGVGLSPFDLPAGSLTPRAGPDSARLAALRDVLKGGRGVLESARIVHGQPVVDMQATNISRQPPPDSTFAAPSGYAELPATSGSPGQPPPAAQRP